MNQSATDRFKNRTRPQVVRKGDEMVEMIKTPSDEIFDVAEVPQSAGEVPTGLEALKAQLDALPKTSSNFQLRFDEITKTEIQDRARDEKVTPETLLEGIWAAVKDDPALFAKAVGIARTNLAGRKKAAALKNTITRLEKVLSS
jgi:hypothetical protein